MVDGVYLDPAQRQEYLNLIRQQTKGIDKDKAKDEFMKMVIEKIFLSKAFNPSSILEDTEESSDGDSNVATNMYHTKVMNDYTKQFVMDQLADDDAFGMLSALKGKNGINNGQR